MSRVRLLSPAEAPLLARPSFAEGQPGPIEASLATVPELLDVALPFFAAVLGPGAASFRQKEIVVVRTSALLGCRYCVDAHSLVALDAGLTAEEVRALRNERPLDGLFTDRDEAVLLAWVDAVAGAGGAVPEAVAAPFQARFAEHLVVELTMVIGTTMLLNRYCTALELPTSEATVQRLRAGGLA